MCIILIYRLKVKIWKLQFISSKNLFKVKLKYIFLSLMWTEHTEYDEYQKLQLSTVVRY